jgi:hypothetical protein
MGGDFDAVRAWANGHLRELLRTYAPDAAAKLRGDRCPCPVHGGDGPNFSLFAAPDGRGELWRCHTACNTSGGGVELVQALTGRPGKAGALEVLRELAPRAGVTLAAGPMAPGVRPAPQPTPGPPTPPARPAVPDPLAALRAEGYFPAEPAALYAEVLETLTLGERGAAYLAGRGFDPDAAAAYGFRSLEGADDWAALETALAASFLPAERVAAGLPAGAIPLTGHGALVLTNRTADGPGVAGVRLRSLEGKAYRSLPGVTLPVPFNAPALHAVDGAELHILEGELNAWALHALGVRAVGVAGAGTWRADWTAALRSVGRVVAWYDDDDAGKKGRAKLAATLAAAFGYEWVEKRGRFQAIPKRDGCKDANDLHRRGELAPLLERAEWRTN